jgi:hypothetical protein
MKKTLTLAFVLGLTTAVSAQFLMRTQKFEDKKGAYTKQFVINLDTIPHIQYLTVTFESSWMTGNFVSFYFGEGYKWTLVNAASEPILVRDKVRLFNLMYEMNWVFQMPLSSISIENGNGGSYIEWLFKRRETK